MINRLLRNAAMVRQGPNWYIRVTGCSRSRAIAPFCQPWKVQGSITPSCAIGKQRHSRRNSYVEEDGIPAGPQHERRAKNNSEKKLFSGDKLK